VDSASITASVISNRLCLDFVNLPYSSGDARHHPPSWLELIEFLAEKGIVAGTRTEELRNLTESDPHAAELLIQQAHQLDEAMRQCFMALESGGAVDPKWVEPINQVLRVTEGHDELRPMGREWRLEFVAEHAGLEWLLAAIARSGAELIASGTNNVSVQRCSNKKCQLFFFDDSRTHRRRWCSMQLCGNRHKVAAFTRRKSKQRASAKAAGI
jgi:predicted RNA-binding Zn ribbon-like protein